MCKDRIINGKQLYDKSLGVNLEYDPIKDSGYHHCSLCKARMSIVPAVPWNKTIKKGRIKDKTLVWLRHYPFGANINEAVKLYDQEI